MSLLTPAHRRAASRLRPRPPARRGAVIALVVVALVVLVLGGCVRGEATDEVEDGPDIARVERVVDGDTLRVRIGGRREAVRLIGIDTPESVRPGTPVECFAKEAARRLAELAPPGARVRLERDVEARDRYGRLLAYAYRRHDGLFLNLALAEEGYAQVATYPPNVAHTAELTAAVGAARAAGRGLWSACEGPSRSPP